MYFLPVTADMNSVDTDSESGDLKQVKLGTVTGFQKRGQKDFMEVSRKEQKAFYQWMEEAVYRNIESAFLWNGASVYRKKQYWFT